MSGEISVISTIDTAHDDMIVSEVLYARDGYDVQDCTSVVCTI